MTRKSATPEPIRTPDDRYLIVRGRLWRASNPDLPPSERAQLVQALMEARRDVARAKKRSDPDLGVDARARVDAAKIALGERGPVWWSDGAPDFTRKLVHNTPYADWFAALPRGRRQLALAGP